MRELVLMRDNLRNCERVSVMGIHHCIETIGSSARFQGEDHSGERRFELWTTVINEMKAVCCAEVGVYKGNFAHRILSDCEAIEKYYMLDPWRHLDGWNKPANVADEEFRQYKLEALAATEFAACKRVILEGRTTDVSDSIPDQSLDFAYIDGDHTLRGITIDLIRIWPKVKDGGVLGGDDFLPVGWQHRQGFDPTLVFPLAVHFAEAVGATIYGLPSHQFAIVVDRSAKGAFAFKDLTGLYSQLSVCDVLGYWGPAVNSQNGLMQRVRRKVKKLISPGGSHS
jgi:hypothetical protein